MILVTGATGHIGNVLIRKLVTMGEKVRALILPGEDLTPIAGQEVEIVEGDVLEPVSLAAAFDGVDQVYHLAGMISIMPGKNELMRRVNVEGTRNMINAALKAGVQRFVYTSSIHALKRVPHGVIIDETLPFDPESTVGEYDRTKAEATLSVIEAVKKGLNAVIVCPTGVIGPFDFRMSEMGELIAEWTKKRLHVLVDGAYDFVDVRDVVKGHILACERGKVGETYLISGRQITIEGLEEMVSDNIRGKTRVLKVPIWIAKFAAIFSPIYYLLTRNAPKFTSYSLETITDNSKISCAKARVELGYKPRSIRESVKDTVQWWKATRKQLMGLGSRF